MAAAMTTPLFNGVRPSPTMAARRNARRPMRAPAAAVAAARPTPVVARSSSSSSAAAAAAAMPPLRTLPVTAVFAVAAGRGSTAARRHRLLLAPLRAGPDAAAAEEPTEELSEEEKLSQDFDYLGTKVKALTEALADDLKGCSIYIVGMMGSGKSTVGRMLANTLRYAFFDTDDLIEKAHPGMAVADIFREHGEDYFRRCEAQVLRELAPYKNLVVSTGGGAVTQPANWGSMQGGIVAWLSGPPDLLARRVVAEGVEKRPLLYGGAGAAADPAAAYDVAHAKLTTLLADRAKYYENADVTVPLAGVGQDVETGAPAAVVMYRLLVGVKAKVEAAKAEREARRNFTIEGLDGAAAAAGGGGGAAAQQQQQQQQE